MSAERCGFAVTDSDGIQQPCDQPATGWRWYQDCEHEDALDVACDHHANEGGRRMHKAEAAVARARTYVAKWIGDELNTAIDKQAAAYCLQDALDGSGEPATVEVAPGATDDAEGPQIAGYCAADEATRCGLADECPPFYCREGSLAACWLNADCVRGYHGCLDEDGCQFATTTEARP